MQNAGRSPNNSLDRAERDRRSSGMAAFIEVKDVRKVYTIDTVQIEALRGVSFEI